MGNKIHVVGTQCFDQYILIAPGSDYGKSMWSDIGKLYNGMLLEKTISSQNKLVNLLHHVHFSFRLNKHIQIPLQGIWKNAYALNKIHLGSDKKYCILYTDVSAGRTDVDFLAELQKKENVSNILIMVNTMERRFEILRKRLCYFDYIFSFDLGDCEKYGFIFHPTNYSASNVTGNQEVENDAFYVGVSKGRQDKLEELFLRLNNVEAKCDFYISGVKRKNIEGIHYNKWLTYKKVLEHIEKANCIVEVMEEKQSGITLRTMEAICYNKRLLTDNQAVKKLLFYNTGYIQVFRNIDDIDTDFIKDKSKIDYGYNNEFSPVHLIEHINEVVKHDEEK